MVKNRSQFWYGGLKESGGKFEWYEDFVDYYNALFKVEKGYKRIVVFHNSKYDMSYIMHHAKEHGLAVVNPSKNGKPNAIYESHVYEVYREDNMNPTFVVDSTGFMQGSLASWGESIGYPKGDTPIADKWRPVTQEDVDYLERDIEILEICYRDKCDAESYVKRGYLTQASATQSEFKKEYKRIRKESFKDNGLKRRFGANNDPVEQMPLPSCVQRLIDGHIKRMIDEEIERSTELETIHIQADNGELEEVEKNVRQYHVKDTVFDLIRQKMRRHYAKILQDTIPNFKKRQKKAYKLLQEGETPHEFLAIEIPYDDIDPKRYEYYIDKYHEKAIVDGMNKLIRGAMRGGMSYVNPKYQNKTVTNGCVIDLVSMYPSILMTYEIPKDYVGSTKDIPPDDSKYYIVEITRLKATVKEGKHPFLKGNTKVVPSDRTYLRELDWVGDKDKGAFTRTLTSVEWQHAKEIYDIEEVQFGRVFYYETDKDYTKAIRTHLHKYADVKEKAPKGSKERQTAKMMSNTLWGRWGMYEKLVDSGGRKIDVGQKDVNLVSAIFTTSYARVIINKLMNHFGDDFIYCDTDSIHFKFNKDRYKNMKDFKKKFGEHLDSKIYGKWDIEKRFYKGRYLKSKTYAHQYEKDGQIYATTAGADIIQGTFTDIEQFKTGHQLMQKKSKTDDRGVEIIIDTTFTL